MKTVYIIEDETILRDLFTQFIKSFSDLEFIGSSGDGQEALKESLRLQPDLVILDLRLPEVNGLEILVTLKKKLPATKVLITTGAFTQQSVKIALDNGTDGFIEKAGGLDDLEKAINAIKAGGQYYSTGVMRMLRLNS